VVACPHALGLAIPLVIAISTTLSARNGILVRNRMALEAARDLDAVVFDKTGTLSRGEQGLADLATTGGLDAAAGLLSTCFRTRKWWPRSLWPTLFGPRVAMPSTSVISARSLGVGKSVIDGAQWERLHAGFGRLEQS
jgi:hypothetical protein